MSGLRPFRVSALVLAFGLGCGALFGIDAPPAGSAGRPASSPWIAEALRAKLPAYVPETDEETTAMTTGSAEMRENVLHLPTMTVRHSGKTSPDELNWLTAAGRVDIALRRFPGTKIGNLLGLNTPWALARLQEDSEAVRKDAMQERGRAVLIEDTPSDRATARLLEAALMPINRH